MTLLVPNGGYNVLNAFVFIVTAAVYNVTSLSSAPPGAQEDLFISELMAITG